MNDEHRADPDQPAETLHFGSYRVRGSDIIGSGGMGIVYRGVHAQTGDVVAIKVAHKAVLNVSDSHLTAIRREIHALRRVRHPGIVHILADDVTNGVPWVAMPFLKGRTLQEYLEVFRTKLPSAGSKADDVTLTADPVGHPSHDIVTTSPSVPARQLVPTLTLIRRLCAPLAFLHGEGLVHRDLKPANIFLEDDERPVLLDLGLAVHFGGAGGREELDVEHCAGTLAYMAPEQLRGELVDARADLYALGCILYECVTGRPPFTGKLKAAIREQHLKSQPIPPSRRIPGLPEELDELILRLLQKRPQDRIGYATDVAAALVALGAEDEPDRGPRPQAYLYRPELLERADALATLEMAVRTTKRGRDGLFLVHGESGVGKTRLAKEVALRAARHELANGERLKVLTGSSMAPGAGSSGTTAVVTPPLHPLRPVLDFAAFRARGSRAEADRIFGPRGKVLSAYVTDLSGLPGQAAQPSPPSLPPKKARARVISDLRKTLWALAERSPIVIMLDDLQWADDLTLSLLAALARAGLANRGILIVAMYRSEEPRPELEELARAPGVTSIPLGRLDKPNIAVMVEGMLARSAHQTVINALVRHSNGNPFFVAEYLRAAIGEGILRRDEGGRFCFDDARGAAALSSLPLPRTLEELIKRRLDRLDVKGQALAAWAAVLGQDLNDELLFSDARDDDAALEAFEALRTRHILEETGEGQLHFVHDKIREIAYQRIDAARRAELHRRAGEALETQCADTPEKAPALGHHFAEAGLYEKAGPYFARAAAQAQEVYANGDAIRFYRAAINAFTRSPSAEAERARIAELHEQLGDVRALIGKQEEARDAYRGALEGLPLPHDFAPVRLYRKLGKTWEMRHKHAEALDLYVQAETALGAPPALPSDPRLTAAWWQEWLQIKLDRISVHYWKAEKESLSELVEAIRPMMERQGSALLLGHYFHALTQRNIQIERFVASDETVQYARECLAAYKAVSDAREGHWVVSARFSLAFILMLHDASLEEAEAEMYAALQAAVRMGDLEVQTRSLTYLTLIQRRLRRLGPAKKLALRSLELAKAEQVNEYAGAALGNLAAIAFSRGDHAAAERAGQEALSYWQSLELVYPFQWLARLPLCSVELAQGRLKDALEQARAVLDKQEQRQQRLPKPLATKLEAAINTFDTGHTSQAKSVLSQALKTAEDLGYA